MNADRKDEMDRINRIYKINKNSEASSMRGLDSSLEMVDERHTHHEGYARNDAGDVGEYQSPPPLGGIHLVIFLPTILEAQC